MKSPSRRRAAVAALLLAPLLSACGFNVQTDQVYQPAEGVNDQSGTVDVLNALVVSGKAGAGTFAATLVNNDPLVDDELTDITGEGLTGSIAEPVEVPAAGLVDLADTGTVTLEGDGVEAGSWVTVTLTFASGQTTTMQILTVAAEADYADVPLPAGDESAADEEETEEGAGTD